MKNRKKKLYLFLSMVALSLSQSMTALAVSEAEVEAVGKETAAGNVFIWFLCTIAFLKISQKIDSFLSSLGINVGHTGGSMIAELMVAARGIITARNMAGGSSFRGGSFRTGGTSSSSFLSGGLARAVGRQLTKSAMQAMTGRSGNPINRRAFESSAKKGDGITGAVAKGSISYTGSITGVQAAQALTSYMGQTGITDVPSYSGVEIGGGRILGTTTSIGHPDGIAFGMYNTEQYMAPEEDYETVTTADNATWYRQYATDTVERTSYMTSAGKIAYHEDIVQKLPDMPKRKDRDPVGKLICPDFVTQHFSLMLEKKNCRKIRFQDLRHSCASLLFTHGVSLKEIQEWLGHSNISTTANIYTHMDFNKKISSANAIIGILDKEKEPTTATN